MKLVIRDKMRRVRRLSTCTLILVLFGGLSAAYSQSSQDDLCKGAEAFIKLIENRQEDALLRLFSEQGTSFIGTAYVPIKTALAPNEIQHDFAAKTGAYCLFFDTKCLREEDSRERDRRNGRPPRIPLTSILDLLSASHQMKFVTYDISRTNGKVTVLLCERTPETARLGQDALNFYFRFEDGRWKLRNVEYS